MKLFKIIITCLITLVLILSAVLTTVLIINRHTEEATESIVEASVPLAQPEEVVPEATENVEQVEPEYEAEAYVEPAACAEKVEFEIVIYQDENVKLTYTGYEAKAYGTVLYVKVENLSDIAVNVQCTDVCIDGCRVYTSGLTCEKLQVESEAIEEFVLLPEDGVDVYNIAHLAFVVKLTKAKSYLDLYESEMVSLDLDAIVK